MEGVRTPELNSTLFLAGGGCFECGELCLKTEVRRAGHLMLAARTGPNEALIRGVGCCSLEKRRGQQNTMDMTTKTGGRGSGVAQKSVSLNCMFSNHFRSSVTEYSPNFN